MLGRVSRRGILAAGAATLACPAVAQGAALRIGLILPMTGPFASTGRQIDAAVKLYLKQAGETLGGRKVEVLLRDDTGTAPEVTRRLAQELVVREKVRALAGFGLTPLAFAAAPVATEAKVPMVVMAAATSVIVQRSPFILRTSFTLPQVTAPIADWALKDGIKSAATLVTDFAPGLDAEKVFKERFTAGGGQVVEALRTPLRNPDYAPFLQRVRDAKPQALFIFVPSGEGAAVMKQFAERGLAAAGVKLIGTGDVVDDDILNDMGRPALGAVTSHHYSAAHDSSENKAFTAAFFAANPAMRPNFMAVGGWDGMHLIAEGLKATNGAGEGEALLNAMKGKSWTSPRGPITIDASTRDIVQDVYIRRVEERGGQLWNIEFDRLPAVRDPGT
ncbi:ABC transporter substrate-binding protein [Paracraurococcus lichenis]|uniref:ABC transporter substrate-binding protein n=1 Tax=Paracraurococcus lichenis TaxID=3064888 RepID=A0ABT9DZX7_9PROT|nr:ABC transporter substrate-binding protein [Paracraurococcus sp. LOR1-02]MDO9709466.1 ABC transporter substrate-binding protein [Paracraurococcus sp. LOR1-02]